MAEINLGAIKFNWKGAYAGGTAYVVDDVVSYQGSSYVCILASTGNLPTNTTYWNVMAEGGDVATILTTQGDILYRDGSGLQRLGAGTSGQVLQTGGASANPSWGTLSSDFVKLGETGTVSNQASVSLNGFFSSDYKVYKVYGYGMWGTSAGNAWYFRANTGASYTENTSSYIYAGTGKYIQSGGNGVTSNQSWTTTEGRLGWSGGGSTDYDNAWELTVYNPQGSGHKHFTSNTACWDGSATFVNITHANTWRESTPMTGIRFFGGAGNIYADNIIMYGLKV